MCTTTQNKNTHTNNKALGILLLGADASHRLTSATCLEVGLID